MPSGLGPLWPCVGFVRCLGTKDVKTGPCHPSLLFAQVAHMCKTGGRALGRFAGADALCVNAMVIRIRDVQRCHDGEPDARVTEEASGDPHLLQPLPVERLTVLHPLVVEVLV
jgi:hypothetical protein